jgi:hypothetical protein
MRGHGSHPLGWTALALVVVSYAHVILEMAAAGLALAIAVRILGCPARAAFADRLARFQGRIGRHDRDVTADPCSTFESPPGSVRSSNLPCAPGCLLAGRTQQAALGALRPSARHAPVPRSRNPVTFGAMGYRPSTRVGSQAASGLRVEYLMGECVGELLAVVAERSWPIDRREGFTDLAGKRAKGRRGIVRGDK